MSDPKRDLELVRRVIARDASAGAELVTRMRCVGRILASRNRRSGGILRHEDLEDLCHEVMVSVLAQLHLYRAIGPIEAWVHRYCDHAFRNAARKAMRGRSFSQALVTDATAAAIMEPSSLDDPLQRCMQRLHEHDQWIMHRKFTDGITLEAIAVESGSKVNTLKSRYARALAQLRRCLGCPGEP